MSFQLTLFTVLLIFIAIVLGQHVGSQPDSAENEALLAADADEFNSLMEYLQKTNPNAVRSMQKRWANQVRFGKRASWASSVRFG
ncbi:unnamed protein product [Caenorhabditis angaria]|uniref:Uncharacterized protein n=1 Tax=Caenorhabditis angaria TaxID=860376 RepID=A0A9P1J3Q0_9PELO|nr:unnamed protein product [Caenorhabditis angaria]